MAKDKELTVIDHVFLGRIGVLLVISFGGLWYFKSEDGNRMHHIIDLSVIEIRDTEHTLFALQIIILGIMFIASDRSLVKPAQPKEKSNEIHSQN